MAESLVKPPEVHVRATDQGLAPTLSPRVQDVSSRISGGAAYHPVLSDILSVVFTPATKPLWVTMSRPGHPNRRGPVKAVTNRRATVSTLYAALADHDEELGDTERKVTADIAPLSDVERFAARAAEPNLSEHVPNSELQLSTLQSPPPQVPRTPQ